MITDDSGGRTEVVQSAGDLDAATAGIASELSRQYFLGYVSTGRRMAAGIRSRSGWPAAGNTVRARRGYIPISP